MKRDLVSGHTIEIPTSMLLTLIERAFEAPTLISLAATPPPAPQRSNKILPAIGADYEGGKFASVTLDGTERAQLVLLPGEFNGSWEDAKKWAAEQGGVLPSRHDGLVLFENLKSEFKDAWYWLDSQHAGESGYAWCQSFGSGSQGWYPVSYACRARAVRRLPLQ